MTTHNWLNFVHRAQSELLSALPALQRNPRFARWASQMGFLLKHHTISGQFGPGAQAFDYDPGSRIITFDLSTLKEVLQLVQAYAAEVPGISAARFMQTATNLFFVHELTHILQNLPHFVWVPHLKRGMSPDALAQLDVTADFKAAWAVAHVEWLVAGCPAYPSAQHYHTQMLLLAYVMGARAFPPEGKRAKVQRLLGVLAGAALNHAELSGVLDREQLHPDWEATIPILLFDLPEAAVLNAVMLEPSMSILMNAMQTIDEGRAKVIWRSVDTDPMPSVFRLLTREFALAGLFRRSVKLEEPAV